MKKLFILSTLLMVSACSMHTTHLSNVSVMSDKNVNLNSVNLDKSTAQANVSGEDSAWTVWIIPFGTPNIRTALDNALRNSNGDLLIDGAIYHHHWYFFPIGKDTIEIKGTSIKTRGGKQ